MALSIKHLNADTTFLLTFSPAFAPANASADFPGSFNILIDPWLSGHSSIWSPAFQISHHTTSPCIQSLTEIPSPDLIIISQDKPDHCHKETLCSLPADTRIRILATPAAAKKIRSWKHFKNATIDSMVPFNAGRCATITRISIPSYSTRSSPGEVTIAYMPQKLDLTALHNAIGITYRAPGSQTTCPAGSAVNLPLSPPISPASSRSRTPATERSTSFRTDLDFTTPPDSPADEAQHFGFPQALRKEKTLSVLYSPHGVSLGAITPYATSHLTKEAALPLTALFHSINVEDNPWFMGGKVAVGYPGGEEIVRSLGARVWISAHDEAKDNRGWSVAMIKSTGYTIEDAQTMLDTALRASESSNADKTTPARKTQVINMESGDQMRIP